MEDLMGIVVRISILYLYVLAIFRLSGKRSVGELTPLDFMVGLILGDLFDDVIWSEVPLSQGVVAITTVLLLHMLVAYASYKNTAIHHMVSSKKTALVRDGEFDRDGMRRERMSEEEVCFELRLQGEDQLDEVWEASLELAGQVSVLKREDARTAQKRDQPRLEKVFQ
jgi:uncharacterized membrane protein YcaP (DUF421 family)